MLIFITPFFLNEMFKMVINLDKDMYMISERIKHLN